LGVPERALNGPLSVRGHFPYVSDLKQSPIIRTRTLAEDGGKRPTKVGRGRANVSTGGVPAWAARAVLRAGRGGSTNASGETFHFAGAGARFSGRIPASVRDIGFSPATCAEARFCFPKRHILPPFPRHPGGQALAAGRSQRPQRMEKLWMSREARMRKRDGQQSAALVAQRMHPPCALPRQHPSQRPSGTPRPLRFGPRASPRPWPDLSCLLECVSCVEARRARAVAWRARAEANAERQVLTCPSGFTCFGDRFSSFCEGQQHFQSARRANAGISFPRRLVHVREAPSGGVFLRQDCP
jgi:hypothetical protein